MKALVIGSGGREHAIVAALARAPRCTGVYAIPGNEGMAGLAIRADLDGAAAIGDYIAAQRIGLVVIGPEQPLVDGLADDLRARFGDAIAVIGPSRAAAALEGSKAFMKDVVAEAGIPTARHAVFDDLAAALAHIERIGAPLVIKTDGLAAGKGVLMCRTREEAREAVRDCLTGERFGAAGQRVVIEEWLYGPEVSAFFLVHPGGETVFLGGAQDHKRLGDGDTGPNTGGMGTFSPSPHLDRAQARSIEAQFVTPLLKAMAARGTPYSGFLFVGLMMTGAGPKLLEYNIRMGDPETQSLFALIETDMAALLTDPGAAVTHAPGAAVTVVLAAPGYPEAPVRGGAVCAVDRLDGLEGASVFHAGTRRDGAVWRAAGGRVLNVTATGASLEAARERAYGAVARIGWAAANYRRDIGAVEGD